MCEERVLILTVGGSRPPLEESIRRHRPDFICFIPSRTSAREIPAILKSLGLQETSVHKSFPVENHDDLVSCYRVCHQALGEMRARCPDARIIADLTGGTKLMSAALLLAVADMGWELSISYVSGERHKDGLGTVKDGSERIEQSVHPFVLTAKRDKELLCQFFNTYRFEAAIAVCDRIIDSSDETLAGLLKTLKRTCEGYCAWDRFRLKEAPHHLRSALRSVENAPTIGDLAKGPLRGFFDHVRSNERYLKAVGSPRTPSRELVDDLVANASRRAEEGKYDDAVARLYRALEMIAQWRFHEQFGCGTTKFRLGQLPREIMTRLFPDCPPDREMDLGCQLAFTVLAAIGDECGRQWETNRETLRGLLAARNDSILAHGTQPLDERQFGNFRDVFTTAFGFTGDVRFPRIDPASILDVGL